jgi:hypothetical protein
MYPYQLREVPSASQGEPVGGGQNLPHFQFAQNLSCNKPRRGRLIGGKVLGYNLFDTGGGL